MPQKTCFNTTQDGDHMLLTQLTEQHTPRELASQDVQGEQFLNAIHKCAPALAALDQGVTVYRGIHNAGKQIKFKPQMHKGYRKSANTYNYYTLLLDHMQTWQAYPARSASVIASLSLTYAQGYGTTFLCIPEGDPVVGVCAAEDFWDSFPHMRDKLGYDVSSLDDFNMCLRNAMRKLWHETDGISTYPELMQALEGISEKYNHMQHDDKIMLYEGTRRLWDYLQMKGLHAGINELLDPDRNHFAKHLWHELHAYADHNYEVWFSAPMWMIPMEALPLKPTSADVIQMAQQL